MKMKLFQKTFSMISLGRSRSCQLLSLNRMFSEKLPSDVHENKNVLTAKQEKRVGKTSVDEYRMAGAIAETNSFDEGVRITSFHEHGFRLNEFIHALGPVILFPKAVFTWNIEDSNWITADSLSIVDLVEPKIETLIVSTGEKETAGCVGKVVLELAHKYNINVEVLTTEAACTQFNYLINEGRMIAAALIPPDHIAVAEDDAFGTMSLDRKSPTVDQMRIITYAEPTKSGFKGLF